MDGSQVWPAWQQGRIAEIRAYCETDVVNTYLLFCRFQLMRGVWSLDRYQDEINLVRASLQSQAEAGLQHWAEFMAAWPSA
jgi:predicted PolB exonuclease-like 3'-5' exonuclease